MLQKFDLKQLENYNLKQIQAFKSEAETRKAELVALKAKGGKEWTQELQDELDDIAVFLVDVDDVIKNKAANSTDEKNASYIPASGTENMVHVSLIKGRRYNSLTGEEESTVFTQKFTFSEWQLFEKNYKGLGFTIVKILHNPFEKQSNK